MTVNSRVTKLSNANYGAVDIITGVNGSLRKLVGSVWVVVLVRVRSVNTAVRKLSR